MPLDRGERDGLMLEDLFGLRVARRERGRERRKEPDDDADGEELARDLDVALSQQVKSPTRAHHEGPGDERPVHRVRVLREEPGVGENGPEIGDLRRPARVDGVADRVLHEGIGDHHEIARHPSADPNQEGRDPMSFGAQTLFAEEQREEKRRLEKERRQTPSSRADDL